MFEIKRCSGEGLGSCVRCSSLGRWNRTWMSFLYDVDGVDGCFCFDCAKIVSQAKSNELLVNEVVNHDGKQRG